MTEGYFYTGLRPGRPPAKTRPIQAKIWAAEERSVYLAETSV